MRIGLALFRLPRFHFFKVTRKTNSSTKLTSYIIIAWLQNYDTYVETDIKNWKSLSISMSFQEN